MDDFLGNVFDAAGAFVTDESSLWDFLSLSAIDSGEEERLANRIKAVYGADPGEKERVVDRIKEMYGVDVSDVPDGNLVSVLSRIRRRKIQ